VILKIVVYLKMRILLWGMGGGYDIFSGFFLYKDLISQGHDVFLGNYSFTDDLHLIQDTHIVPVTKNTVRTKKNKDYFPEHDLASFLDTTVYAGRLVPPPYLGFALSKLCSELDIQCIIGIDAGFDALLFGDEGQSRGSPVEDMTSVVSLCYLSKRIKCLMCCVSVTTENMSFIKFQEHLETMGKNNGVSHIWDMRDEYGDQKKEEHKNVTDEFERLLDITSKITRSIPNECLLAAMRGIQDENHYINPRLKERGESEKWNVDDYPPVNANTSKHFVFEVDVLYKTSPLIKHLYDTVYAKPMLTVDEQNVFFHRLIDEYYSKREKKETTEEKE